MQFWISGKGIGIEGWLAKAHQYKQAEGMVVQQNKPVRFGGFLPGVLRS